MVRRKKVAPFLLALLVAVPVVACAPVEEADEEVEEMEAAEDSPTLADFAGTWQQTAQLAGTEEAVELTVVGTPESDGWSMQFEGRDPVPLEASVEGDSLIMESAEYESILRPGVMVSVRSAGALQNGRMTGTVQARYQTEDGEETVPGTFEAVRVR